MRKNNYFCVKSKWGQNNGFTLIELLVVIAIIGLLASVILMSVNASRKKARITKRVADLTQIAKAMELYYNKYNKYPEVNPFGWRSQCASWGSVPADQVVWDTVANRGIVPEFVSKFPSDPSMIASVDQSCYIYISNGANYKLLLRNISEMTIVDINQFGNLKDPCRNDVVGNPCGFFDPTMSLSIYSPGAIYW